MKLNLTFFLIITAAISITGTFLIRYGGKDLDFSKGLWYIFRYGYIWIFGMFICWIAGLTFSFLLTKFEITTLFSLYVPFVYFCVNLGGFFLFNEAISIQKIMGLSFILIGLIFLFLE